MANNVSQCVAKENQWSGGSEYELCTKVGGWVAADSQMFLDNLDFDAPMANNVSQCVAKENQ